MPDFDFRRASERDFAYCWPIYRDALQPLAEGVLVWDDAQQQRNVRQALADDGASILVSEASDSGWLLVSETRFVIHLAHLYIEPAKRGHGLGASLLRWMSDRARRKGKDFTLDMMKNNRARALYERLGFKAIRTAPTIITMQMVG